MEISTGQALHRIRNFEAAETQFPQVILLRVFIMTACPTYRSIIAMQMRHLHAGIIRGKVICIRREIHSYARRKKPRYHLSLPACLQKPLLVIINRRFALPLPPLLSTSSPFSSTNNFKIHSARDAFSFDFIIENFINSLETILDFGFLPLRILDSFE